MFLTFLHVEYLFWFIRDKEPAFSQVSLNRFLQTKQNQQKLGLLRVLNRFLFSDEKNTESI